MYILREYFDKFIPINVIVRLQDLMSTTNRRRKIINPKEGYSAKVILECFKEHEAEIKKYVSNKFFNKDVEEHDPYTQGRYDTLRGYYLMAIIKSKLKNN
jgi:hypothetical protein